MVTQNKKMKTLFSLFIILVLATNPIYSATLEVDDMEYSSDANAQAAYVSNGLTGVIDQQQTTEQSYLSQGDEGGVEMRNAQSFQLSNKFVVTKVDISFHANVGSPTGNITLKIETNNAGEPSGTLANANATKELTITPAEWNSFIFATPFILDGSTTYWIRLYCDNQATNSYFGVHYNSTGGYSGGNLGFFANGTWSNQANSDLCFKVYVQPLQSYSEATIKTQGSYSLKAVAAATDSLNKTLTKTFAVNSNLTGVKNLRFDAYALRTGSNWKLGIHDTGGTTTEITPSISTSNTWQPVNWDLSAVADANKDNIDTVTVTVTNADSANTIYLDYYEIAQAIDVFGWVQ